MAVCVRKIWIVARPAGGTVSIGLGAVTGSGVTEGRPTDPVGPGLPFGPFRRRCYARPHFILFLLIYCNIENLI